MSRLSAPLIEEFRDQLLTRLTKRRAAFVLGRLKQILSEAQRRGLVMQNVALPVCVNDTSRDQGPVRIGVDVPSKGEVQAMLAAASGGRRAGLMVLVLCGLRGSEWRGLFWEDIDFGRRTLTVRRRADRYGTIGRPKSKNGYREIPLAPIVINALRSRNSPAAPNGANSTSYSPARAVRSRVTAFCNAR